jgi:hypothetical protein
MISRICDGFGRYRAGLLLVRDPRAASGLSGFIVVGFGIAE